MFTDLNPTLASTDTDAHPEYHIPKTDSIETDDELVGVKVKVSLLLISVLVRLVLEDNVF